MSDDALGDAAHENPLQSATAMSSHTDEVNAFILGLLDNKLMGSAPHMNDGLAGETGFILNTGECVCRDTPPENIEAFVKTGRKPLGHES